MYLKVTIYYFLCMISSGLSGKIPGSDKGRGVKGKILGGEEKDIVDYPYLVWVAMKYVRKTTFCGGSYIAPLWVLTASHCIDINNEHLHRPPRIGEYMTSITCTMGMTTEDMVDKDLVKKVIKHIMHPSYKRNKSGSQNDIALLQVAHPFSLSPKCQMISLPTKRMKYSGKDVTIMGYSLISSEQIDSLLDEIIEKTDTNGTYEEPNPEDDYDYYPTKELALRLRAVNVTVRSSKECKRRTGNPAIICVGEKNRVPCQWDSGGPLIYNNMLIGVGSRISYECTEDYGRYEDVFRHRAWISSFVKFKSSSNRHKNTIDYLSLIIVSLCSIYIRTF